MTSVSLPEGVLEPDWNPSHFSKTHDWRRYISDEIQSAWGTFTAKQIGMLYRQAQSEADREEWD